MPRGKSAAAAANAAGAAHAPGRVGGRSARFPSEGTALKPQENTTPRKKSTIFLGKISGKRDSNLGITKTADIVGGATMRNAAQRVAGRDLDAGPDPVAA